MNLVCEICQKPFVPTCSNAIQFTCSPKCRRERANRLKRSPEGRAKNRKYLANYRKSQKGKKVRNECNKRWQKTEKGRVQRRESQRRYYARKKRQGVCTRCGCWKKPAKGKTMCRDHLAALREEHHDRKAKKKAA